MSRSPAIVLHIPHSSALIPAAVRASFLLSEEELRLELLRLTDAYTDELFDCAGAVKVRYPVSRLVVDPERFESDADEVMSRVGMGVVYTHTCDGRPLRNAPSPSEREALLGAYYRPHHAALTDAVATALHDCGRCLIIDCHSFPSHPLPYEIDQRLDRPDICIGTDEFHTPPALKDALVVAFTARGYSVDVNRPFAGALVPSRFYRTDRRVHSVMIELNRALYMNEFTGEKSVGFGQMREDVQQILANGVTLAYNPAG